MEKYEQEMEIDEDRPIQEPTAVMQWGDELSFGRRSGNGVDKKEVIPQMQER